MNVEKIVKFTLVKNQEEDAVLQKFVNDVIECNKEKLNYWLSEPEIIADPDSIIESFTSGIVSEVMATKTPEQVLDYISSGRLFKLKEMLDLGFKEVG